MQALWLDIRPQNSVLAEGGPFIIRPIQAFQVQIIEKKRMERGLERLCSNKCLNEKASARWQVSGWISESLYIHSRGPALVGSPFLFKFSILPGIVSSSHMKSLYTEFYSLLHLLDSCYLEEYILCFYITLYSV